MRDSKRRKAIRKIRKAESILASVLNTLDKEREAEDAFQINRALARTAYVRNDLEDPL